MFNRGIEFISPLTPDVGHFLSGETRRGTAQVLMDHEDLIVQTCCKFFFLKFLEDMSSFCGATDTPVLDFW